MKITVIGTGNGAYATAVDLTQKGHEVTLYASSNHKSLDEILESKKIKLYDVDGLCKGEITIHNVTHDSECALSDAEIIIPVIPSYAHEECAKDIAPYIKKNTKVILSPGSTGGALVFAKVFREEPSINDFCISELHTLPYTARKVGGDGVRILLILKHIYFSTFPAKNNAEMFSLTKNLYPQIIQAKDVIETSLNNGNAVSHPAPMILNAGKIEYYGKHSHYKEGITPSVANVIQCIDDERKAICKAYGYDEIDIKDRLSMMGYCKRMPSLYECYQTSTDVFLPIEGPNTLTDRYLVEDTGCSILAMMELASLVDVKTPFMTSILVLASGLMGFDFREKGRTLDKMGLAGMSIEQIKKYIESGEIEKK